MWKKETKTAEKMIAWKNRKPVVYGNVAVFTNKEAFWPFRWKFWRNFVFPANFSYVKYNEGAIWSDWGYDVIGIRVFVWWIYARRAIGSKTSVTPRWMMA